MPRGLCAFLVLMPVVVSGTGLYLVAGSGADQPLSRGVVVVLGSTHRGDRLELAGNLAKHDRSLLISSYEYCAINDYSAFKKYAHRACFRPAPLTTQGEARFVVDYALKNDLDSITVITTADQARRARVRFGRCWSKRLAVVVAPASVEVVLARLPYEAAASVKAAVFQRSC